MRKTNDEDSDIRECHGGGDVKGMKKVWVGLTMMLLCFAMTACGNSNKVSKKAEYALEIAEVFTCSQSYQDNDVVVINFNAKNNTDEYVTASSILWDVEVANDGITLPNSYLYDDNPYSIDYQTKIAPGETKLIQKAYELIDVSEDAQLTVKGCARTKGKKSKQVLILDDVIEMATIEKKESVSEYDIQLDKYYVTIDNENNPIIVIDVTFTNNSSENAACGSVLEEEAFSGSSEAQPGWLPSNHPLSESNPEDTFGEIKPGASAKARYIYQINDESAPFEFSLRDWRSFDHKVIYENEFDLAGGETVEISSDFKFEEEATIIGMYRDEVVVLCMGNFTNNSDETFSASCALNATAFQGGLELDNAYISALYSIDFSRSDVEPGTTVPVFYAFELVDCEESVKISINDRIGFAGEALLEKEYTIDELIENTKKYSDEVYLDKKIDSSDEMVL